MYIAVLADNIADRKQTERLLGRANDVLANETGTLYIDSYGDAQSLMRAPMKYELFFLEFFLSLFLVTEGSSIVFRENRFSSIAEILLSISLVTVNQCIPGEPLLHIHRWSSL